MAHRDTKTVSFAVASRRSRSPGIKASVLQWQLPSEGNVQPAIQVVPFAQALRRRVATLSNLSTASDSHVSFLDISDNNDFEGESLNYVPTIDRQNVECPRLRRQPSMHSPCRMAARDSVHKAYSIKAFTLPLTHVATESLVSCQCPRRQKPKSFFRRMLEKYAARPACNHLKQRSQRNPTSKS